MQIASSLEKTLMLGKTESRREEGDRGCDGWVVSPMDKNLGKLWELVRDREARHAAVHGVAKRRT